MSDLLVFRTKPTTPELEAAAIQWDKLADDELASLEWDRHAIRSVVDARVKTYRRTAEAMRIQIATGVAVCSCCHKPFSRGISFLNVD